MSDLVLYEPQPLTAAEMKTQVQTIQQVMASVMVKDVHYGVIPGCGNKPALYKPGAEKLMMTFRLAADPQVVEVPTDDGITFRVFCRITNQATGIFLGNGVGECSSKEEKYNWRATVSEKEWANTAEDRKRIKYTRNGEINQIRTNPADVANTVLKMAKKRALVDAILTVTAASDIFEQDLEEMDPNLVQRDENGSNKKPVNNPQGKTQGSTQPASGDSITDGQKKLIFAKSKAKGVKEEDIKAAFKVEHISDLKKSQVNDVIEFIDQGVVPGGAAESDPNGCPKDVTVCGSSDTDNDMNTICGINDGKPCPYAKA